MTGVGRSCIFSHWPETKLKMRRLRESGVDEQWLFRVSFRILHLDEESNNEERVYTCDAEVDAEGPSPLLSLLGEKAPGANFVTTA